MRNWVRGKWQGKWLNGEYHSYQITAEQARFMKLFLAWESKQLDEAVWDRQAPLWISELVMMGEALQDDEATPANSGIILPGQ